MKKVKELIAELQKQDPEKYVVVEGCDCEGNWSGEIMPCKTRELSYDQDYGWVPGQEEFDAILLGREATNNR